jgi:hypothetical protein
MMRIGEIVPTDFYGVFKEYDINEELLPYGVVMFYHHGNLMVGVDEDMIVSILEVQTWADDWMYLNQAVMIHYHEVDDRISNPLALKLYLYQALLENGVKLISSDTQDDVEIEVWKELTYNYHVAIMVNGEELFEADGEITCYEPSLFDFVYSSDPDNQKKNILLKAQLK